MDGANADIHEWVRGVPGCFEKTLQGIRNLVAADTPPQIIMSLMRCNAEHIEAMVAMAENLGAESVKFNIVQPTGRGEKVHTGTNGLEVEELIDLGKYVEMELAPKTDLRLVFDYPPAFHPLSRIASGDGSACGILGILGVIASGHYALCGIGEHIPELVFGTVGKEKLEDIWRDDETLNSLREGLPDSLTGICEICIMKHVCYGSCIAQNYYRTDNLWGAYWFCEQANEIGKFPATRKRFAG
jgi:SynChlorMet cassette radical SAM/SPASM protein ScmF